MYKVEFLPIAKQDLSEIVLYIKNELNNPQAAESFLDEVISAAERLGGFPYSNPVHNMIKPLKNEYRKTFVKNYILFYTVDENKKLVTVSRIIYGRRDISKHI